MIWWLGFWTGVMQDHWKRSFNVVTKTNLDIQKAISALGGLGSDWAFLLLSQILTTHCS